ncbi:hypothetical protein D3C86_2176150 [compost metagenome]
MDAAQIALALDHVLDLGLDAGRLIGIEGLHRLASRFLHARKRQRIELGLPHFFLNGLHPAHHIGLLLRTYG